MLEGSADGRPMPARPFPLIPYEEERTLSRTPRTSSRPLRAASGWVAAADPAAAETGSKTRSRGSDPRARDFCAAVPGSSASASAVILPTAACAASLVCQPEPTRVLARASVQETTRRKGRRRADTAREVMRQDVLLARNGHPSRLEKLAVTDHTMREYQQRLMQFESYCADEGLPLSDDDEIQVGLLEYLDQAFLDEQSFDHATKLVASLAVRWPHLHRAGRLNLLPRVSRALQAWGRLDPPGFRLPIPMLGVAGIAVLLVIMNLARLALGVMLAADAYLRPGELLSLTKRSIIPGRPGLRGGHRFVSLMLFPRAEDVPSKTYQFDDAVVLDSAGRQWISAALMRVYTTMETDEPLVGMPWRTFREHFRSAVSRAGLDSWEVTPHHLRHAGPSDDYLHNHRSLADIQRRGRWAATSSMKRYEKASQVNARLLHIPEATVRFLEAAAEEIPDILVSGAAPSARMRLLLGRAGLG